MFLGMTAYLLVFVVTSTGAIDIASSDHSIVLFKVLFVIYKDPSCSDNTSMLSVLLCGLYHTCFIYHLAVTLPNFIYELITIHLSYKISSVILY